MNNLKIKKKDWKLLLPKPINIVIVMLASFLVGWLLAWIVINSNKVRRSFGLPDKDKPEYFMKKYFNSHSKDESKAAPESIFLIEAGDLTRLEVAKLLNCLDTLNPAVIGLDILYLKKSDSLIEDTYLINAINKCGEKHRVVLPSYYDNSDSLIQPFFFDSIKSGNVVCGTVNFDNPWDFSTRKKGEYSFVYLLAESYLERKTGTTPDTAKLIIDYRPNCFNKLNYNNTLKNVNMVHFTPELIKDNIVCIGTIDEKKDPIFMDFYVKYNNVLASRRIPGMTIIAYQVNSLIEPTEAQIKKTNGFYNVLINFSVLILYLIIYYFIKFIDSLFEIFNIKNLWIIIPLIRFIILIVIEIKLINIMVPLVDSFLIMPNIMVAMIALPFVSCFDICIDRYYKTKVK